MTSLTFQYLSIFLTGYQGGFVNLMLSYRHFVPSGDLNSQIRKKVTRLLKRLGPSANVQWTLTGEKNHYRSEVKIQDGNNNYYVKAENGNLYKTFDEAIKKLKQQLTHSRRYATIRR